MKKSEALMVLQNFIIWYTSDDAWRKEMNEAVELYIDEDHALEEG